MPARSQITFHGLTQVPDPSSSQRNPSPPEEACVTENNNSNWRLFGGKQSDVMGQHEAAERELTLHGRDGRLCKEREEQEVDEVDEGQGVVPEQAGCRDRQENNHV